MYVYMTLRTHSNPYQGTVAPGTLLSAVGAVGHCNDNAKTSVGPGAAALFSVRDVIGNPKKDVESMEGQGKIPFFS